MKKRLTGFAVSLIVALQVVAGVAGDPKSATFEIDPVHSSVTFKVRHLVSKVEGNFREFSGTIVGDPVTGKGNSVTFKIKAGSLDTRNADRDTHLRAPDFFDVEKYPEISFKSNRIEKRGDGIYEVTGTFTLRGVSKELPLQVAFGGVAKDPWGKERAGFSLRTTINRKDFGVSYNKVLDQGGLMLGDEVEISIEIEAVRTP